MVVGCGLGLLLGKGPVVQCGVVGIADGSVGGGGQPREVGVVLGVAVGQGLCHRGICGHGGQGLRRGQL